MTPDASVTALTPADIALTLKNITEGTYTGGSYSTAAALIEAWKTNVTDALATYVGSLTEGEDCLLYTSESITYCFALWRVCFGILNSSGWAWEKVSSPVRRSCWLSRGAY